MRGREEGGQREGGRALEDFEEREPFVAVHKRQNCPTERDGSGRKKWRHGKMKPYLSAQRD